MDDRKRKRLEAKGWKIGSTKDFLQLSDEEEAYIELKLSLSRRLKELRTKKRISQTALAKENPVFLRISDFSCNLKRLGNRLKTGVMPFLEKTVKQDFLFKLKLISTLLWVNEISSNLHNQLPSHLVNYQTNIQ